MRIQPEVSGASLVLVGAFNPRIFRPDWFSAMGVVGDKEAASATIKIIHPSIASFSLDWAGLDVTQDRFAMSTEMSLLIRLRDFVVKTFKEFLPQTPIVQLGINRWVHFSVGSFQSRDKIGSLLAPKEPWGSWGKRIAGSSEALAKHGGVLTMTMTQRDREDEYKGSINARIEPSAKLPDHGIFMEVNDHYEVGELDKILGSDKAMEIIENQWDVSMERAETIFDQIMALKERV